MNRGEELIGAPQQLPQLVVELRADVARLQANYATLQALLDEVARTVAGLCEQLNGPHASFDPLEPGQEES